MEITELQVNNYILFKKFGHGPGKVGQMMRGDFGRFNKAEYWPVLLTGEWLEKLGFIKEIDSDNDILYTKSFVQIVLSDTTFEYWLVTDSSIKTVIQYVHQLQNLYHALTGELLTSKL